jgi:hypothetical protein
MKTAAEQKFNALMKEALENKEYNETLNQKFIDSGYDKSPEFETLKRIAISQEQERQKTKKFRMLKVASFILAVLIVSSATPIVLNSNIVSASMFEINNFLFSIRHGFVTSAFQFNTISSGRELIIEKEEQIPVGRDFLRELKIPNYVPDGYNFLSLRIINNATNEYVATFLYKSTTNDIIMIRQERLADYNFIQQITGVEKDFQLANVRFLYVPSVITGHNTIFAITSYDLIQISGHLELEHLIYVFDMLK